MKKAVISSLAIFLSFLFLFQTSLVALADDEPEWVDIVLTDEEIEEITSLNPGNMIMPFATGLIDLYSMSISKSGSNLIIYGRTLGNVSVVKSGFTIVTIKRRVNSNSSWSTYKTYQDLYNDRPSYTLSKSLAVPTGYQWKIDCTHYAKKSAVSTQKINNTSNIV